MKHPYQDSSLALNARVDDLLSRMTIEEKVGQLMQLNGQFGTEEIIKKYQPASLLHINGADADTAIRQALATRLGIPVLLADDGIHGHSFWAGATIFPTQLGMAGSWNTLRMEQAARITAREMRATGIKWTFSPVLCIARDLRWGRVDETFGEDPFLIGEFAEAMVRGYQNGGLGDPDAVLATAKHFAGYSETEGGRDASEGDTSRRKLRSFFLPPFERVARSGCMAFMTGYQSTEGVPSTANHWLLKEVLRDEWGFDGVTVTDWDNVGRLVTEQFTCADFIEAATVAVRAGNDLMMVTPQFYEGALEALKIGKLQESEIDPIVRRVLSLKFSMGLFENPGYSDPMRIQNQIGCAEHQALNLDIARESLILLHNDGYLPAQADKLRRIAVIGPNADDPLAQLGDWSLGSGQMDGSNGKVHPRSTIVTVLDGLRSLAAPGCKVEYQAGCSIESRNSSGIPAAVKLAKSSDLTVLVVGDNLSLTGEMKSTATLNLQGAQEQLVTEILSTGKPVVVVLVNSKPLALPECIGQSRAIIEAFNPGMQGGRAIAELIFGLIEPVGKLTISIPHHVGQLPVYYNQIRGQHGNRYADMTQDPAYPFGHGLSYTRLVIFDLKVLTPEIQVNDLFKVKLLVKNIGKRPGVEVVQLYIEDVVTSCTWAHHELKAYARVTLAAGENREIELSVPASELSIVDANGKRIVEAGKFKVHVGNSSRLADCLSADFIVV